MRAVRTLLVGAVLAASIVTATPFVAQADDAPAPQPGLGIQADGRLWAYYDTEYRNPCGSWSGSSNNWGDCWNTASSLVNYRYPGANDDVWVRWGLNNTGARRGVYNGVWLNDLNRWAFDAGTGSGSGQLLGDNIASHSVTQLP
nr:hypothetical protein OG409_26115 [Streptomyces sp. NBC_00974]